MTTTAHVSIPTGTVHAWTTGLASLLVGLDPFDAEDRPTFRSRVQTLSDRTMVSLLRDLAAHFGHPVAGNCTRGDAQRALADAWLAQAQRDAVGRTGLTPTQHATLAWYAGRQAYVARGRVVESRGTATFNSLFAAGFLCWDGPAPSSGFTPRPVRVTDRGLAWLDAAGTVVRRAG